MSLRANVALDGLTSRIAEQERASQRIVAETARALAELDQHFAGLAETGDQRAAAFAKSIGRARSELQQLAEETGTQDTAVEALAERAEALQTHVGRLTDDVKDQLSIALGDAEAGAERLIRSTERIRPELDWMRDAAIEASERITASAASIADQQDRFAALLATLDEGVGTAGRTPEHPGCAITEAQGEATRLSHETGPALVDAMVQVKEAAAHAAERAREAIANVIPQSAASLSEATRDALEKVIREEVEDRCGSRGDRRARRRCRSRRVGPPDRADAVHRPDRGGARAAYGADQRRSSARRTAKPSPAASPLLIDSMHSAAIDVGKILSDEVDDKAWDAYLKGNRGVFTRRAVRLLEGIGDARDQAHYDSDPSSRTRSIATSTTSRRCCAACSPSKRRRDDRGDSDVVRHGQALRRPCPGVDKRR